MVILMLNLLISIVAESYGYIIENQSKTRMRGMLELNIDIAIEGDQTGEMNEPINTILYCTRELDQSNGDDDQGVAKRVARTIGAQVDKLSD